MRSVSAAVMAFFSFLGTTALYAADILIAPGVSVGPSQSTYLQVTLVRPAPQVTYATVVSSNPGIATVNPSNIVFLEGATTPIAQPQITGITFGTVTITASSFNLTPATQTVQVNAALSFGPSTQTMSLGSSQPLFLTMSAPAPVAQLVMITSDNPSVASVPASVTIPANGTFANVLVKALGPGVTMLHATGGPNTTPAAVTVTVTAPGVINIPPLQLNLGKTSVIPISLGTPAPPGGLTVTFSSSDLSRVSITQPNIIFPGGSSTPSNALELTGVSLGTSVITGSAPAYAQATQTASVNATFTLAPQNLTLAAGSAQIAFLGLSAAAPPDGFLANLTSDNPGVAHVQGTLGFFPDGSFVANNAFLINALTPGTTTIHASYLPFIPDTTMNVTVVAPGSITLPTNLGLGLTQSAPFPIQLGTPALPGGVNVALLSADPTRVSVSPGTVFIAGGATTPATQPQVTALGLGTVNITASAPGFNSATVSVTVTGASPDSVNATGGTPQSALINTPFASPFSATVTDAQKNPVGGVTVVFRAPITGPSGLFAGGQSTVSAITNNAGVATSPVFIANGTLGSYTVSAIVSGVANPAVFQLTNTIVTIGPIILPGSMTLTPNQVVAYPVTLGLPAPGAGVTITLASSDSSKVSISPATVFIAAGSTAPATQPQVTAVNFGSVTINASAPGFASASQTVQVAATMTLSPGSMTITGTATQNLTLTLSAPAPAAGATISIGSSNPGVATVPTAVTFAANATSVPVPVTGVSPGTVTITASSGTPALPDTTASVTIKPAADILLPSSINVGPGQFVQLSVSLTKPATRTLFITLSSSDSSKVTVNPVNLIVPEGATMPTVQPLVNGLDYGSATVTASVFGLTSESTTVKVTAAITFGAANLTLSKGTTQMIFVSLSAITPTDQVITLSSDNPGVATVPAQVIIRANGNFTTVAITGVNAGSTIIRASGGANLTGGSLNTTVVSPASIIVPSNVSLDLGQTVPFPVSLAAPAPSVGVTITLGSSNSSLVGISPGSIFIPAGSTVPSTQPQVSGNNIGSATINASAPGYATASQVVPVKATLTFMPQATIMSPGSTQIVFLLLSTAAPPDGFFATLSSDNPSIVDVQHTVGFFPDGSSVATNAIVINSLNPGTTTIRASAPPFIPETTLKVTVVGSSAPQQ